MEVEACRTIVGMGRLLDMLAAGAVNVFGQPGWRR